jgi:excisionase family DNA binding protein
MTQVMGEHERSVVGDGLVTVAEACKFLGLSRATLYVIMDKGDLQYCKIGGARRIPRRALVALAEQSLVAGER